MPSADDDLEGQILGSSTECLGLLTLREFLGKTEVGEHNVTVDGRIGLGHALSYVQEFPFSSPKFMLD